MQLPLFRIIVTEDGVKIDADTKRSILEAFWPKGLKYTEPFQVSLTTSDSEGYFRTYANQCNAYLGQRGHLVITRTHHDVVDLVSDFKHDLNREQVHANLVKFIPNENSDSLEFQQKVHANLSRAIDLAARIFLMMKIWKVPHSITNGAPLEWTHGTLGQFVTKHFDVPPELSYAGIKLPKMFNAHNIERIGGIKIKWTDNLADHLRMVDDDERVAIFAHPTFLMLHSTSDFFPPGFVDEAEPGTLSKWWWDRCKRVQWYTFWIAVLVLTLGLLFGIIQSTATILQTHATLL
ncbi:hypothetical protein QBC36DRAFT_55730 [Triangularia setosa]|uniref:Uncharacterized protein n=1 Tax=Triangularia setosa TaxID=2587417 RepID=A0AAN7A4A2_9PEZI|nr:hypothetical protein QBC36DRAFT_55730 [Podospora setosa]